MTTGTTATAGGRFRIARKRAGLTQKDLAASTGVAQSTISEMENDENSDIKASSLVALCHQVGVTAEYVLLGARAARNDQEAEAVALLRAAGPDESLRAIDVLRALLGKPYAASGVQAAKVSSVAEPPAQAVPPEIIAIWAHLTPKNRRLWEKAGRGLLPIDAPVNL